MHPNSGAPCIRSGRILKEQYPPGSAGAGQAQGTSRVGSKSGFKLFAAATVGCQGTKTRVFASESAQTHHTRTTTHYWHHAAQCYSLGVHYWRLGSRQGQQAGSAGSAGTAGRVSRDSRDIVSSPLPPPCSSPSAPPASPRRCCRRRRRNWGSQWRRGTEGRRESEEEEGAPSQICRICSLLESQALDVLLLVVVVVVDVEIGEVNGGRGTRFWRTRNAPPKQITAPSKSRAKSPTTAAFVTLAWPSCSTRKQRRSRSRTFDHRRSEKDTASQHDTG